MLKPLLNSITNCTKPYHFNYNTNQLLITYFQRKPIKGFHFSVEIIFNDLRKNLSSKFSQKTIISKYYSKGFLPRVYNCIQAFFNQSNINHVTGDISYVGIFLQKNKTIHTILDCVFLQHKKGIRKQLLKYFWLTMPINRSKFITTISHSVKKEILEHSNCNADKIIVIPIAVGTEFVYTPKQFNTIQPRVLLIGTAPNKNVHRTLQALATINCFVNIVGKYQPEIESKIKKLHIPFQYDSNLDSVAMKARYDEADILVFASTYEGFGMPIIEAQSVGVAVVTSNISSMPEVANGAAVLVDPYNIDAIKAGINTVINNEILRKQNIENGLQNVKQYTSKRIAQQYMDLYNQVLNK